MSYALNLPEPLLSHKSEEEFSPSPKINSVTAIQAKMEKPLTKHAQVNRKMHEHLQISENSWKTMLLFVNS